MSQQPAQPETRHTQPNSSVEQMPGSHGSVKPPQEFQQQPVSQGIGSQHQQVGVGTQQTGPQQVQPKLFPTRTYLTDQQRQQSIQFLNQALADTVVLLSQARYAHWNVRGPNFFQHHELFEDLAELLVEQADEIAERISSLGGQALGTVHLAAAKSQVKPIPQSVVQDIEFVEILADNVAMYNATLSQYIHSATDLKDLDTADLLNEISREIGKYRWFLEAHLPVHQQQGQTSGGHQQLR